MKKTRNLNEEEYRKLVEEHMKKTRNLNEEEYHKLVEEYMKKYRNEQHNKQNSNKVQYNEQNNEENNTNTENINERINNLITNYININRNNHQYKYVKKFKNTYKNIQETNMYKKNCKKLFSTNILKDEIFYKSYGFNQYETFNNELFKTSPFMWFAENKKISRYYGRNVYTFKLTKDINLINICSRHFIKDFTHKINFIFADYEFIRDLLFFPFGNISPILQQYYKTNYFDHYCCESEALLEKIQENNYNIYEYLLYKGVRESRLMTDAILMFVLIKLYPQYDGYIARSGEYDFHSEICIFKPFGKIKKTGSGGGKESSNITNKINNPLQYNIDKNIDSIVQLGESLNNFIDNAIKSKVNMCNELLDLTLLPKSILNNF